MSLNFSALAFTVALNYYRAAEPYFYLAAAFKGAKINAALPFSLQGRWMA